MDKIYLILNIEDTEPFVINICSTLEKAEQLAESYRENFRGVYEDGEIDFIIVDSVTLNSNNPILWDAYE